MSICYLPECLIQNSSQADGLTSKYEVIDVKLLKFEHLTNSCFIQKAQNLFHVLDLKMMQANMFTQ